MIFIFGKKKEENVKPVQLSPGFEEKISIGKLSLPTVANKEGHTAEDISKIVDVWLDPKHIDRKTRLNKRQVKAVTIFKGISIRWKIITLQDFLIWYLTYKLSEDGQSSKELENILKARMPELQQDNISSKLGRFLE